MRTEIEWQGDELRPADGEFVAKRGDWQVFAESLPNLEVRIGAILALERIAQQRDDVHVQVMQILCAYIRENAKAADALPPPELPEDPEIGPEDDAEETWRKWRVEVPIQMLAFRERLPPPRTDIQTALDVLARRTAEQRRIEAAWQQDAATADNIFDAPYPDASDPATWSPDPHQRWVKAFAAASEARKGEYREYSGYRLDLRGANLQGCDMAGGCWRGARFDGAQMQGANLEDAEMQGAVLVGAQMQGAVLPGAQMQGAGLAFAQMQGADLEDAEMQEADLRGAQMQGAGLGFAQMQRAVLRRAQMQGAVLVGAQMQGAGLGDARMQDVDLGGTVFDGATDLRPATMRGAALWSVDFSKVFVGPELLQGTFGDASVKLPEGLDPPEGWARDVLDNKTFRARWTAFRDTLPDPD